MDASIEYIAGFFDGEGCIRATVAKDGKNASEETIDLAFEILTKIDELSKNST